MKAEQQPSPTAPFPYEPLVPKQHQQHDWKGNPVVLSATATMRCKGGKSSPFCSKTLNIKPIFEEQEK